MSRKDTPSFRLPRLQVGISEIQASLLAACAQLCGDCGPHCPCVEPFFPAEGLQCPHSRAPDILEFCNARQLWDFPHAVTRYLLRTEGRSCYRRPENFATVHMRHALIFGVAHAVSQASAYSLQERLPAYGVLLSSWQSRCYQIQQPSKSRLVITCI